MPRIPAWHSMKQPYHHNNGMCVPTSRIAPQDRIAGTGNKPLCPSCQKLNRQAK